jgi:hypothetical protein
MPSRSKMPAAVRRSAYLQRCEQRGRDAVPFAVPRGFSLALCEPLSFPIGGRNVRLTWADVARHAAPAAPVAGVVVLSTAHATAIHSIPYGDKWPRVFCWRPSAFSLRGGESLELAAHKHGTVLVFPFVGVEVRVPLHEKDAAECYVDPLESLPPLPETLLGSL